ncbi:ATP-dependent DNA helicase PIF1-like [Styela clava]
MVGATLFSWIDQRLREIKKSNIPFGNVSVIVIGDLFQLPPVMDSWIFCTPTIHGEAGCLSTSIWSKFSLIELTDILRQKNDLEFCQICNRVREGKQTQNDIDFFNKKLHTVCQQEDTICTLLFKENAFVDQYNAQKLASLDSEVVEFFSVDVSADTMEKCDIPSSLPLSRTAGLSRCLQLKVGCPVMVTCNVDTKCGLTNGVRGVVQHLENTNSMVVWVKFDDPAVGNTIRNKTRLQRPDNFSVPIVHLKCNFLYKKKTVSRRQIPLRLCFALTVHKAQGQTLDGAIISMDGKRRTVENGLFYVAITRIRSSNHLHLKNFNESYIRISAQVSQEMKRLRSKLYDYCETPLRIKTHKKEISISYLNISSLRKHINDLKSDFNLLDSTVLCIAETWLRPSDSGPNYYLENFNILERLDGLIQTNGKGLLLYSKMDHGQYR